MTITTPIKTKTVTVDKAIATIIPVNDCWLFWSADDACDLPTQSSAANDSNWVVQSGSTSKLTLSASIIAPDCAQLWMKSINWSALMSSSNDVILALYTTVSLYGPVAPRQLNLSSVIWAGSSWQEQNSDMCWTMSCLISSSFVSFLLSYIIAQQMWYKDL